MSCDEDEYGVVGEDVFAEVLKQPLQTLPPPKRKGRSAKRCQISYASDNDSIVDFLDDDDEEVEFNGCGSQKRRKTSLDEIEEHQEAIKKKSKYKIHIPKDNTVPPMQIQYGTQVGAHPDSSPYRIRGAMWKLPRNVIPQSPQVQGRPTISMPNISPSKLSQTSTKRTSPVAALTLVDHPDEIIESPMENRMQLLGSVPVDLAHELANLPSDAFSSSPETTPLLTDGSIGGFSQSIQRLVAPQNSLRQMTLFGGQAPVEQWPASQINKVHNYRIDAIPEAPTHHKLDQEALKTWVYPTNLGATRDYQFNIVRQGLFHNMLVALPTGLGKTFIAATVMLNYFRWTKDAQIVFMAPTKPLVSQQVDACFNIAGIPRSVTTMLTGEINPSVRQEEWETKRVFFMTPQTLDNDLRAGVCDPKRIVLLVVDEAHRAKGEYSYVKVVSFLRRFSCSFRVLALTATPGSTVEAVQEVIDGLEISKVEIRTEESMDIQQYTHIRKIEKIVLEPSDEIIMIKDLLSKALQPLVNQLCGQTTYFNRDPMALTTYGLMVAQKKWSTSDAGRRANQGIKNMMRALFSILASVAHGIKLLSFHGISPFYQTVKEFRSGVEDKGEKGSKYKKQIVDSPHFKKMMDRIGFWINKDDFVGHPKLTFLCDTVLNHFLDAGEGRLSEGAPPSSTRVIVFSEFRDSAEDIVRILNRHGPMIRASVFVGQADSKRSAGMNQATQLETIRKFKSGVFNVIVATSIGEEGLDIGQVDLIVCYDASGSPIRMLQRMGRTGRKRAGNIVLLLMKGKEEENFSKAKDNYEQMQKMIASGTRFNFRHELSTRIVPKDISPKVDKMHVEIPVENTQNPSLPEPKRRASKTKKRAPKKFHMPDGVETGFHTASKLLGCHEESKTEEYFHSQILTQASSTDPPRSPSLISLVDEEVEIPLLEKVILDRSQMKELARTYQNVYGEGLQEVSLPETTNHPKSQRSLRPIILVKHGRATKRFVKTIKAMNNVSAITIERWQLIQSNLSSTDVQNLSRIPSPDSSGLESPPRRVQPLHKKKQPKQIPTLFKNNSESDPNSESGSESEFVSQSIPARRKPLKAKLAKRYQRGRSIDLDSSTKSLISSNDDDDDGEDLEDFVVEDSSLIGTRRPSSRRSLPSSEFQSSPPCVEHIKKHFFEPTSFIATQETNGDDELPDIGMLVRRNVQKKKTSTNFEEKENLALARKGKRRIIVEDTDDE